MTTHEKKLKILDYAIDEVTNDRSTSICFPIQVGLENEGLNIYIGHANEFHFPTFYDYKPENPVGAWWFPNTPEGKAKRLEILESLKRDIKADVPKPVRKNKHNDNTIQQEIKKAAQRIPIRVE